MLRLPCRFFRPFLRHFLRHLSLPLTRHLSRLLFPQIAHLTALAALLLCAPLSVAFAQTGVTWEQQAERLQNVSATLLDAMPMGEPVNFPLSVQVKAIVSFLPKTNPKVGAKSEKVPSAPVHTVPTLQVGVQPFKGLEKIVGAQVWAGYLPSGGESLFGIKAKLSQWLLGGALVTGGSLANGIEFYLPIGFQVGQANLKGAITEPHSTDVFTSKTTLLYLAPGVKLPALSAWANVMVARKSTHSQFSIPSDDTNLTLDDTLADASVPAAIQVSVGWMHASGVQIGLSEVWVPNRLNMPRLLLAYDHAIK